MSHCFKNIYACSLFTEHLYCSCQLRYNAKSFVEIRSSLHLLERIACSVKCNEPVLLVGETGTGKTTLVQNLAKRLGQKLTVLVCIKLLIKFSHKFKESHCKNELWVL